MNPVDLAAGGNALEWAERCLGSPRIARKPLGRKTIGRNARTRCGAWERGFSRCPSPSTPIDEGMQAPESPESPTTPQTCRSAAFGKKGGWVGGIPLTPETSSSMFLPTPPSMYRRCPPSHHPPSVRLRQDTGTGRGDTPIPPITPFRSIMLFNTTSRAVYYLTTFTPVSGQVCMGKSGQVCHPLSHEGSNLILERPIQSVKPQFIFHGRDYQPIPSRLPIHP